MPPKRAATAAIRSAAWASSPRLAAMNSASAPTACNSASTRAPLAGSRPVMATRAPSVAARNAIARPMPELPPVTRTIFPRSFIIFLREKRWPSGRRGIATRVARHGSHGPHFSMFSKVLWGDLLVYCMDVQLSTYRSSGLAPAGEGQTCLVALGLGARGQHGLQLLQRTVGESVRARTALFVWIRFLAVPQRCHAR